MLDVYIDQQFEGEIFVIEFGVSEVICNVFVQVCFENEDNKLCFGMFVSVDIQLL